MKYITLDTNAYSLFIKGDLALNSVIKESQKIFLSTISIGELYSGFYKGDRFDSNEKILIKFINNPYVFIQNILADTARVYGEIRSILVKKGTLIPTNDIWIAACAIETDSTLITYDKHFLKIPNLKIWNNLK